MKPYSLDLRQRVIQAYEDGQGSQRQLAQRFSIAPSTLQNWIQRKRRTGSLAPAATGGSRSKLDANDQVVLARLIQEEPDATLQEWASRLEAETGRRVHPSTLWRAARRLGLTRKQRR